MFTNWLTGSSTSSSSGGGTPATRSTSGIGGSGSGGPSGVSASALVMSSPPDVILEVGPAPSSVRFVAHSLVLGMHSGYLRSAIRLDEASSAAAAAVATSNSNSSSSATTATGELLLYLSNVTADQFAPLLTYMYTGYLDLTVDNIFAVLLATHVLHMPRALEICRSFLARAQTEGYLNGNPAQLCPVPSIPAKVIRPIPSKATMPNFGFLPIPQAPPSAAPPQPQQQPPPHPHAPAAPASLSSFGANSLSMDNEQSVIQDNEEDEDVEVFIDSNTVTDNEADPEPDVDMDCNVSVVSSLAGSSAGSLNIERLDVKPPTPIPTVVATIINATPKSQSKSQNSKRESLPKGNSRGKSSTARSRKSTGLQVAKAPVPAAQLEMTATPITPSKFIIDVASCDGPVRFRRILNTAYGHKPESLESGSLIGNSTGGSSVGGSSSAMAVEQHRSQQSVSYSFHQQMARAISSQQRQLSHQQQEESENSGDATAAAAAAATPIGKQQSTGGATAAASSSSSSVTAGNSSNRKPHGGGSSTSTSGGSNQELYVCVYCKHTFKSQYCYQKHAKRHLNPLSLTTADKKLLTEPSTLLANNLETDNQSIGGHQNGTAGGIAAAAGGGGGGGGATTGATGATANAANSALLRREVRPLDMNVQYYPCKTCGSKFPSYYFVHKHRKMCHADEIEATATSNNNSSSNTSTSSNSNSSTSNTKREAATVVAAAAATADDQQAAQQQQQS
ncbi:uncharacterized protein LOC108103832 [Drosophila eugracilis]|uniref:uncharacterized protein LOC108103832 n=1 Tax=Drosophila eugracilis TaxID=29029 RepID=UPI0007E86AA6|nr:uncharacterized protein LOC108103832 [Drosophila eugracilis]